jgi:hypothetical protein
VSSRWLPHDVPTTTETMLRCMRRTKSLRSWWWRALESVRRSHVLELDARGARQPNHRMRQLDPGMAIA